MKLKTEKHYSCEWFWNYKPIRKCHNVVKTVTHYKKKPECKTVPKYHCEEKWDKDEYGKKVRKVQFFRCLDVYQVISCGEFLFPLLLLLLWVPSFSNF